MLTLVKTCEACPEQYDVYDGTVVVGYLRLRHGRFRVDVPTCGGTTIYEASPDGDGMFEDHERDYYLRFAVDAIERHLRGETPDMKPPAPNVPYQIKD